MKKFTFIASAIIILCFAHCKTKQKAVESSAPMGPTPLPTVNGKNESELQMEIAQTRWPNTVVEELHDGNTIYTTKCTKCHKNYKIEKFTENKWLHELDKMSPKAKLTQEEKLKLTKFILSYRETKEKMKGN